MKILIANIGSTSLKYRLFEFGTEKEDVLAQGGFERVTDYPATIEACLAALREGGHIRGEEDLAAVGFKTVLAHNVSGCRLLTEEVLEAMSYCNEIAPAHNPPYIAGIRLFAKKMPNTPLIGLFETAFYQWAPEPAKRYAVPASWHELGIRRLGFHGASHKFVAERSAELLGREDVANRARRLYVDGGITPVDGAPLRVVSCHLGGSSSVTGILNGVAIGNSMGLSPQSGLPQNNRVGDLDSGAIAFVMAKTGISMDEAQRVLCKESGLLGLSGVSNDLRDIQDAAEQGNASAQLAVDYLVYMTRQWIGSYMIHMGGLDALVFTAGIGENRPSFRTAVCQGLEEFGVKLDESANEAIVRREGFVQAEGSRVRVLVIPTNEELVVAREVRRHLESNNT